MGDWDGRTCRAECGLLEDCRVNRRNRFLFGGVLATMGAWGCFAGMELEPDFSPTSNALNAGGYLLVALALALFAVGFTTKK